MEGPIALSEPVAERQLGYSSYFGQQGETRVAAGSHTYPSDQGASGRRRLGAQEGAKGGADGGNSQVTQGPAPAVEAPKLPPKPQPRPQPASRQRCVFVLATGRSGSTSLLDALNQLPNYLIRGEQEAAFWDLYQTWRQLGEAWRHSREFQAGTANLEPQSAAHLSFAAVKGLYEAHATQVKLPWFNDLHPLLLAEAVRAFYNATYGHHGPEVVSGFKEVRFVRGRAFPTPDSTYKDFADFLAFLRGLCTDVKILLNSRASAEPQDNHKLYKMVKKHGKARHWAEKEVFGEDLKVTHAWQDRYATEHPDHAFRVIMEDMFNDKVNASLARRLLGFLGEDPEAPISFARMPHWSDDKPLKPSGPPGPGPARRTSRRHLLQRRLAEWGAGVLGCWLRSGGCGGRDHL